MGKSPILTILVSLLGVSALITAVVAMLYIKNVRTMGKLQPQLTLMNSQQNFVRGLITETMEYSKTHPDIDPTLQALGLKAIPSGAAPNSSKP